MSRSNLVLVLTAVLTFGLAMPAAGLDESALQEQLAVQAQQIAALQTELSSMKQSNLYDYQTQITEAMVPAPAASQGGGGSLVLPAGWTLKPYGYIKADVVYDDSAQPLGDLCGWASGEDRQTRSDDEIHFTARQTRLGMVLTAPNIGDLKAATKNVFSMSDGRLELSCTLLRSARTRPTKVSSSNPSGNSPGGAANWSRLSNGW